MISQGKRDHSVCNFRRQRIWENSRRFEKKLSPDAALVEGKLLNTGLSPADLRAWCQSLAL